MTDAEKVRKVVTLALLALLVGSVATIAGPTTTVFAQSEDAVDFATNVEFIRGHLEKAIENKNADNIELAAAHAGHPVDEVYALITVPLASADAELDEELDSALVALANNIDDMSAAEVESAVADINTLLDEAMAAVVGESDSAFWAQVIAELLEVAEVEYSEAVEGGEIIEEIEYQDAEAFAGRASVQFRAIEDQFPEHEAEETEEFIAGLRSGMKNAQDPSEIDVFIRGVIHEIHEVTGLAEGEEGETTTLGYIENIEALLAELEHEYAEGEYSAADSLAVRAYLDNFEFVEGPLAEAGEEELMLEIEDLMRVQLRELIAAEVPADEVSAHIDLILERLELAEQALS